jgi:hypothetical protein
VIVTIEYSSCLFVIGLHSLPYPSHLYHYPATILAAIGSIDNFPNAGSLKSYFGWSPKVAQSGVTLDYAGQTSGGTRTMKQMMFLIVWSLVRRETEWAKLYERLVQAKCPYDPRTGERTGKLRVLGRVAGQVIEAMYALLKTDAEVLSKVPLVKSHRHLSCMSLSVIAVTERGIMNLSRSQLDALY